MKKTEHYVDNVKFYKSLIEYRKRSVDYKKKLKQYNILLEKYNKKIGNKKLKRIPIIPIEPLKPKISEYMGKCILMIAQKLTNSFNFRSYTYKEEMISDAVLDCIKYAGNFDPKKTKNPFAYFTQICYYASVRRIKSEKKQKYIKSEMIKNSDVMNTISDQQDGDDSEYKNSYLQFLMENIEQPQEKLDKKYRKTTKEYQKKMKDLEEKNKLFEESFKEEVEVVNKIIVEEEEA